MSKGKPKHNHAEAFKLMWYACGCGHAERIWNSRDGVTPFTIGCPSCGDTMQHVAWGKDLYAPDHKLIPGQRFWRDGTPEEAVAGTREIIALIRQKMEFSEESENKMLQAARDGDIESDFRKGWPMIEQEPWVKGEPT